MVPKKPADLEIVRQALEGDIPAQREIAEMGLGLVAMLIEKNRKYGNAALDPIRVFSRLSPLETIHVRMDDKLSRIRNGAADEDEDPILDLAGYCILELIARRRAAN